MLAVAAIAACNKEPLPLQPRDAAPTKECSATRSVSARIEGSWRGDPTNELATPPRLVVHLDDEMAGPVLAREIVRVELARPFFDADVKLAELCSDSAATRDMVDVQCVTGSQLTRVVVKRAGDGFDVTVDGQQRPRWKPLNADECYEVHGLGARRDLEPARAAWGRDAPSERCGSRPRTKPVHVALDFVAVPGATACSASGPVDAQRIVASTPGWKKDLGVIANLCGGTFVRRTAGGEAIVVGTNDMGVENRDVYRLGDRLYAVTEGDVLESTELPCGAKVTFDIHGRVTTLER